MSNNVDSLKSLSFLFFSFSHFRGDMFQMFAKEEWGLQPNEFSNLISKFDSARGMGIFYPEADICTETRTHTLFHLFLQ